MLTHLRIRFLLVVYLLLLVAFGLQACGNLASSHPTSTILSVEEMQTIAVQTFFMQQTLNAPTATETLAPTLTPTPTETPGPTSTPAVTPTMVLYRVLDSSEAAQMLPTYIAFYLIVPETGGECTYYMRPVLAYPYPLRTGVAAEDVTTALKMLFALNEHSLGAFQNPLAPAGHRVVSVIQQGSSLAVNITGDPARTDNPCTNRQMRDQIFTTVNRIARDFGIYDIVLWLDTLLYDDYMIGK